MILKNNLKMRVTIYDNDIILMLKVGFNFQFC